MCINVKIELNFKIDFQTENSVFKVEKIFVNCNLITEWISPKNVHPTNVRVTKIYLKLKKLVTKL